MTRSHIAAGLMVALSLSLVAGCNKSGNTYTADSLSGQWTGESEGVHTMIGYSHSLRTLTVTDQDGNQFRGEIFYKTTAEAQLREGTEKVYGSLDPATGRITIISGEDNGVFNGAFVDKNTLKMTYVEPGPGGIVTNFTLKRVAQ